MMNKRYRRIVLFFGWIILTVLFWDLTLPRIGLRRWAERTRDERLRQHTVRFRALALDMGGVMIKVGQWLSARLDVLPPVVTDELADLQDEVRPEPFDAIRTRAEGDLGMPLHAAFEYFDERPLAAASIGQAHRARLYERDADQGYRDVVVKVQRPNIDQIVEVDLRALDTVAGWVQLYEPIARRVDVPALFREFGASLRAELDYPAEGRNAERFAVNAAGRAGIAWPRIVWRYTTAHVLTMEDVSGIKISNVDAIRAAGVDPAEVAARVFDNYLQQVFEDSFFHADPHPGNLFVRPLAPPVSANGSLPDGVATPDDGAQANGTHGRPWELVFIDFGMMGELPAETRRGLKEIVIAVGTRDAARVVRGYQQLGFLLPSADLDELERAGAKVFDRFWGRSTSELSQISYAETEEFVDEFTDLLYDAPFQLPQNMILAGRMASIVSGLTVQLDPEFNIWERIEPFANRLIADDRDGALPLWLEELLRGVQTLVSLPGRVDGVLGRIERGSLEVKAAGINGQLNRIERNGARMSRAVFSGAMLLGGVQLWLADERGFGAALVALAVVSVVAGGRR